MKDREFVLSTANSLYGTTVISDSLGRPGGVVALSNGNYVVVSNYWDNGASSNVGAATCGEGRGGSTGPVTTLNSIVGNSAGAGVTPNMFVVENGLFPQARSFYCFLPKMTCL